MVPVLSEQITDTEPKPSTDFRFLTIAFFLAIFLVDIDNTIVTIELNASGITATASAIEKFNVEEKTPKIEAVDLSVNAIFEILKANKIKQITNTLHIKNFASLSKLTCKGVFVSLVFCNKVLIFPISVF